MTQFRFLHLYFGLGVALLTVTPLAHAASYIAKKIEIPGVSASDGTRLTGSLNNSGQVAGNYFVNSSLQAAFVTGQNGIGLTTILPANSTGTIVRGLNNSGQIVGDVYYGSNISSAFRAQSTGANFLDLGSLGAGGSTARAINDSGQVAGLTALPNTGIHQVMFVTSTSGQPLEVVTLGASFPTDFWPNGMNNNRQIAWTDLRAAGGPASYLLSPVNASGGAYDAQLIQIPGITISPASGIRVNDINEFGQVVGHYYPESGSSFAYFTGPNGLGVSETSSLDPNPGEGSYGYGINNQGDIVGEYYSNNRNRAFLYTQGNRIDLTDASNLSAGVELTTALDVNDSGQILALNASREYYLLTPIPEPSTLALFALGGFFLRFRFMKKKTHILQ